MFNSRKSDHSTASSEISPMSPSESRSMSAPPTYVDGNAKGQTHETIVDGCLTMRGDLESEGNILVQGKVIGNIKCKRLIIDTGALVEGAIEAADVFIRGKTKGSILADRVRLERTADVDSEICQTAFCVEEGARVRGMLKNKPVAAGKEGVDESDKANAA
jgi:cytoskeletal protein CcmA (bactofilin family)